MDADDIERILASFEEQGVEYAVFGGIALMFHGISRFTEDLDIFIRPEEKNIECLRTALASVFDDPSIEEIKASDLLGEYPAIQYVPPEGGFHLDLLTRLGTAFSFEDLQIERVSFRGLMVSVVDAATLYRMKRNTVRLQDRADAARLLEHFTDLEEE